MDLTFGDVADLAHEWAMTLPESETIRRCLDLVEPMQPGDAGRAELLDTIGGLLVDDDPARALEMQEEALRDGGPTTLDPRHSQLLALLKLGRTDASETLLSELRRSRDPSTLAWAAEVLEEEDRLVEAERFANIGLRGLDPDDLGATHGEDDCLVVRFRIRRARGVAEDAFDRRFADDAPNAAAAIRERSS